MKIPLPDAYAPHWAALVSALHDNGFEELILAPSTTDAWAIRFIMDGYYDEN